MAVVYIQSRRKEKILLSSLAFELSVSMITVTASLSTSIWFEFHQFPVSGVRHFPGLNGKCVFRVQVYNLCKPLVNGKVLIHSVVKCSRV